MIATALAAPTQRAHFEIKAVSGRRFTGLASTWDIDHGGDLIVPGAYKRTLEAWKGSNRVIPLIDQHNYGSVTAVVGKMVDARETREGLETEFEFLAGEEGERYSRRVKDGLIDGLSIGYHARGDRTPTEDEKSRGARRVLTDIELKEVSLVIWGMNPYARIDTASVKSLLANMDRASLTEEQRKELRGLASQIGALLRPIEPKTAPEDPAPVEEEAAALAPDSAKQAQREEMLRQLTLKALGG